LPKGGQIAGVNNVNPKDMCSHKKYKLKPKGGKCPSCGKKMPDLRGSNVQDIIQQFKLKR